MNKVYIKGVPNRGQEVIAKLERLGGRNIYNLSGEHGLYFISPFNKSICVASTNDEVSEALTWLEKEIFIDEPVDNKPKTTEQKNAIKPLWDEELKGVYIPIIDKVLDPHNLSDREESWNDGMRLAEEVGKTLPTKDEGHILMYFKDEINKILLEHGGDELKGWTWLSAEHDSEIAWYMDFSIGNFDYSYKYYGGYVRAISSKQANNKPKSTEIKKYDPVMVSENGESWKIKIYLKENRCSSSIETIETYGNPWTYIVPISNFNFNNLKSNIKRSIV